MLPYWLLFSYFAAGAVLSPVRPAGGERGTNLYLLFGAIIAALMIGTRYEVGADWKSYEFLFAFANNVTLERALDLSDPGYQFVNWTVQQMNGEIWWVNLICGTIFMWGLYRLARNQPLPILSLLVAVPYLIIVVAMGYTRQSAAIGFLMAGLAALGRSASVVRFAAYVAVAALFHKTAVLVLPLVIFAGERNRLLNLIAGIALSVLFYDLFLAGSVDQFVKNYIEVRYSSQGAWIRVILNLVPATLLLTNRRRLGFSEQEERAWRFFAYASLAMPFLLILTPSSTAVDRVALYLMPLQVVVVGRAYLLFKDRKVGLGAVTLFALLIQFTWLNFAQHASYWLPYRSTLLLEDTNDLGRYEND